MSAHKSLFSNPAPVAAERSARRTLIALGALGALGSLAASAARAQDLPRTVPGSNPSPTPGSAVPGEDLEREQLARIAHELERLQDMVADAARHAPSGQRVTFHYAWLARDLELVRRGVNDHLDAPRQPRPVPPLRGEYRQ